MSSSNPLCSKQDFRRIFVALAASCSRHMRSNSYICQKHTDECRSIIRIDLNIPSQLNHHYSSLYMLQYRIQENQVSTLISSNSFVHFDWLFVSIVRRWLNLCSDNSVHYEHWMMKLEVMVTYLLHRVIALEWYRDEVFLLIQRDWHIVERLE